MVEALVTGSFDPITKGHFSLIKRAASAFDAVTVCLFVNPDKTYLFSEDDRLSFIRLGCEELGLSNVTVDLSSGYVADYAEEKGIGFVIRGIRDEKDMPYEVMMANENRRRNPNLETYLWTALPEETGISSTAVRMALKEESIPEDMLLSSTVKEIRRIMKTNNQ